MSIYYRREQNRETLVLTGLQLGRHAEVLKEALPQNFTREEFLNAFKQCFTCQWEDIVQYCNTKKRDYVRRKKKNQRVVRYMQPTEFLLAHCSWKKHPENPLPEEKRAQLLEQLKKQSSEKKAMRDKKLKENLIYVQQVCPSYVRMMISNYFQLRKSNTLDINARYLILLEVSQFKCEETITFLYKVNANEKNDDLRKMAFYSLQRLGEHPWLARKRKGKQKQSQINPVNIKKNPTALLELIYSHQQLIYQSFDVFLSHSSLDVTELLRLKGALNSRNLTVYIDWVNDREMLQRANQNDDTWNALNLRMEQSKRMLFVLTDNSILSPCTQREVEYFQKLDKQILVYQPHPLTKVIPDYLKGITAYTQLDMCLKTIDNH